jgi:hypothetical protein
MEIAEWNAARGADGTLPGRSAQTVGIQRSAQLESSDPVPGDDKIVVFLSRADRDRPSKEPGEETDEKDSNREPQINLSHRTAPSSFPPRLPPEAPGRDSVTATATSATSSVHHPQTPHLARVRDNLTPRSMTFCKASEIPAWSVFSVLAHSP